MRNGFVAHRMCLSENDVIAEINDAPVWACVHDNNIYIQRWKRFSIAFLENLSISFLIDLEQVFGDLCSNHCTHIEYAFNMFVQSLDQT